MVIDHFRRTPRSSCGSSVTSASAELDLMVRFGFVFGFLLGVPVAVAGQHRGPVVAAADPRGDRRLGDQRARDVADLRAAPSRAASSDRVHGLFLRRQDQAAEVYARIIAEDVITLERIGDFLLNGPRGDRTRQMLSTALRPAIDLAAGPARGAVRVAMGADGSTASATPWRARPWVVP